MEEALIEFGNNEALEDGASLGAMAELLG